MWTKPQATGVVVGLIAAWLFLMGYMEYTLLTLVCRLFQLGAALWFVAAKLNKAPNVTRTDLQDCLTKALNAAEPKVVSFLGAVVDIISWQDSAFTGKVFAASLLVSYVGSFFSDLTLVFLVTLAVFAGPITYQQNKEVIDQQIKNVTPMINDAISKIPMLSAQSNTDASKKTQ